MARKKDISASKVKDSETSYQMLFEDAGDPIFVHDEEKILAVNTKACELLGYTKDELLSITPSSVDVYDERVNMPGRIVRLKARGIMSFETIHQRKDGTPVSVEVTAKMTSWNGKPAVMSICRDITRKKRAENILLTAALEWQLTFDTVRAFIFLLDPDFKILRCNRAAVDMFGGPGKEILGRKYWEIVYDTAEPVSEYNMVRMKKTKRREISLIRFVDRWLEVTADPILDDEGDFSGAIYIVTDITELRNADEEAKKLLSLLNATLESTTDGILVVEGEGKIIYSNSRFTRMWGMPEDVMLRGDDEMALAHVLQQLKNPELFLNKVKYLYEHPEEDSFDTIEFKDGKIFERYSKPQRIAGKPVGRVWSFRDVTISRKAAESLNSGERQYKSLVETTNTGYVVIDMEGRVLDANQEYVRLAGKNELREILGHKVTEWTAEPEKRKNAEAVRKCAIDGYIRDLEIDYVDSSGKITPVELNATAVNSDEGPKILTLCRDITERRKSEEALLKSELLIRRISNNLASGMIYQVVVMKDGTRRFTYLSDTVKRLYGITPDEGMADAGLIYGRIHPEDVERVIQEEDAASRTMSVFKAEVRMIKPDGGIRWSSFVSSPNVLSDGTTCWDGIEFDITSLKQAEEELVRHRDHLEEMVEERAASLMESEKKYRELVENTNSIILRMNKEGDVTFFNEFAQDFFGFSSEEIVGKNVVGTIVPAKDTNGVNLEQMILEIGRHPEKFRNNLNENIRKNSERVWIAWTNKPIFDDNGKIAEIMCVGNDISDRVKTEKELDNYRNRLEDLVKERTEELRKKEENLSKAQSIAHLGNWNREMLTGELSWSDEARRIFGFEEDEEITFDKFMKLIHTEDIDKLKYAQDKALAGQEPICVEYRIIRRDGETRYIDEKCEFVFDDNRKLIRLDGIVMDITERRKVEMAFLDSESRFRKIVEQAPISMAIVGMDGTIEYINKKSVETFGYPHEDIPNMDRWYVQAYPDEEYRKDVIENWTGLVEEAIANNHEIKAGEYCVTCKDGTRKTVLIFGVPISGRVFVIFDDITRRKQSEDALRKSKKFNESLIQTMPLGFDIVDEEGNILFLSPVMERILGSDSVGKLCWNKYKDDKQQCADCPLKQLIKVGATKTIQTSGVLGGKTFEITHTGMMYQGKKAILEIFNDITERKKAEEALSESEERFRTLFENSRDALMTLSPPSWKFTSANPAIAEMFGVKDINEFIRCAPWELSPERQPDGRLSVDKAKDMIEIAVSDGYNFFEWKHRRVNGDEFLATVLLSRVEIKGELVLQATVRDISAQKKAEQELRDSEEKFRTLFNTMTEGVALHEVIRDPKGNPVDYRIIDVNPAYEKHTGLPVGKAKGALGSELYGTGTPPYLTEFASVLQTGRPYFLDTYFAPIKKIFSISVVSPGKDLIATVFEDVTERKHTEERLRQSEKMEAIGQLAGGIAHDFNNQLMGIMGYAEMLYNRLEDENMRKDAENILRISRRSSELTKQMLAFARKGKYQAVPVNIHKLIEEVIGLLSHSVDKRIEIKRVLKASPATIMGDSTQLQNAFLNLGINARDAMPNGGELTFTTEALELDGSYFGDVKKIISNRYLKICVIDNGLGMDRETINHIFEPFFTTKAAGKGTGMGLASVYGTVNSHNGVINVESDLGKGTVFSIFFPLYEEEGSEFDDSNAETPVARKEVNILLVDDEEVVRDMVARMLRSLGHNVVVCNDGLEALEYYKQEWQKVDLVIMDMVMPRMNGRDSFMGMLAINPKINAILISGYSIDGEVQRLLDSGMKGFIQKPFNTKDLDKAIERALNSRES